MKLHAKMPLAYYRKYGTNIKLKWSLSFGQNSIYPED
jgi:hypothetical protein